MTKNTKQRLLFFVVASAFGSSAFALDPMAIGLADGVALTPTLKIGTAYDDNFRAVERRKDSSWVTSIAPTLTLGGDSGKVAYGLSYTANHEIYHSSRRDDNTDHLIDGNLLLNFDARNRLRMNAGYKKIEETASQGVNVESDKYTNSSYGLGYTFGADSATGQIRLGLNHDRLRYNNKGVLNADKERNSTAYVGTFLYRVAPRTKALVEGRFTDHGYVSNKPLDNKTRALLLGAEWEATAFTTGSFRLGQERKNFDQSGKRSLSKSMWELGVSWSPRTYSTFSLNARGGFDEGSDGANAINTRSTSLSWNHGWTDRIDTNVSYTRTDQRYQGISRKDKMDNLGIGMTYQMRRWLDVGVGYTYTHKDSNAPGKSYKRNVYGLTLNASL